MQLFPFKFHSTPNKNKLFKSVLVALNGEESDKGAIELAYNLTENENASINLVNIVEIKRSYPIDIEIEGMTVKAESILKNGEELAEALNYNAEAELLQSRHVGLGILHEAADKNVEAIIICLPHKTKYGDFNLGEVVPYLLENAHCNVIIWQNTNKKEMYSYTQ